MNSPSPISRFRSFTAWKSPYILLTLSNVTVAMANLHVPAVLRGPMHPAAEADVDGPRTRAARGDRIVGGGLSSAQAGTAAYRGPSVDSSRSSVSGSESGPPRGSFSASSSRSWVIASRISCIQPECSAPMIRSARYTKRSTVRGCSCSSGDRAIHHALIVQRSVDAWFCSMIVDSSWLASRYVARAAASAVVTATQCSRSAAARKVPSPPIPTTSQRNERTRRSRARTPRR